MNALPTTAIDWKETGYMTAGVLAVLGLLRRMLAPFAVEQVRLAMQPEFNKLHTRIDEMAADLAQLHETQHKLDTENAYLRGRSGL